MNNKTVLPAVFSLVLPLASAAILIAFGGQASPALGRIEVSGLLLAFNAAGLGLSVLGLAGSNPSPVNTSLKVRITAFCAAIGILLDIVAIEVFFAAWYSAR